MDIPRLDAKGILVELVNNAIKHTFLALGYAAATSNQDKAIREFLQGRDVSFLYQPVKGNLCALPLCQVCLKFRKRDLTVSTANPLAEQLSICIVVNPLISLMKDQVAKFSERGLKCAYFSERGLKCAYLGEDQNDPAVKAAVIAGDCQLVYTSILPLQMP